jgi:two-component system response regulator HydG
MDCRWPGNVRELENVLERSLLLSPGSRVEELLLTPEETLVPVPAFLADSKHSVWKIGKQETVNQLEYSMLDIALKETCGNVRNTATALGLTPRSVYFKLKRYQIDVQKYRVNP